MAWFLPMKLATLMTSQLILLQNVDVLVILRCAVITTQGDQSHGCWCRY